MCERDRDTCFPFTPSTTLRHVFTLFFVRLLCDSALLHCFVRFYEAFWKDYVSPYGAFANYSKHPARQALSHTNQC